MPLRDGPPFEHPPFERPALCQCIFMASNKLGKLPDSPMISRVLAPEENNSSGFLMMLECRSPTGD